MTFHNPKKGDSLTPSEKRVYDLIVNSACCDKQIAKRIFRTVKTAKFHKRNIFKKKGVSSSLELAVLHYNQSLKQAA